VGRQDLLKPLISLGKRLSDEAAVKAKAQQAQQVQQTTVKEEHGDAAASISAAAGFAVS